MKVSVIIPVCNRVTELERSVNSVITQSHSDVEVIVVENNSDNPAEISEAIRKINDARVKFYSLEQCKNANVARNFGMSVSLGEFISFLDSDDEYETNHIEDSLRFLINNQLDFCFGSMTVFDGSKSRVAKSRPLYNGESGAEYLFGGGGFEAPTPTYFLTKQAARTVYWDEELERHQDWDFFCRLMSMCKGDAKVSPSVIVHWLPNRKVKLPVASVARFYKRWRHLMSPKARRNFLISKIRQSIRLTNPLLLIWSMKAGLEECCSFIVKLKKTKTGPSI